MYFLLLCSVVEVEVEGIVMEEVKVVVVEEEEEEEVMEGLVVQLCILIGSKKCVVCSCMCHRV